MRIWDIDPGYLNRQSLLGEHRELHGMVSIIVNHKNGYANHPETRRWADYGWALKQRHDLLVAEMSLRGYQHKTPVMTRRRQETWPPDFIDLPAHQFEILQNKYIGREAGRIPLPKNAQQLWAQHKYSVMARDPNLYRRLGRQVSTMRGRRDFAELMNILLTSLRTRPGEGGVRNALQHMWGHIVADDDKYTGIGSWSLARLLKETRERALRQNEIYLVHSTALGELASWLR